jgi:ATP-dependent DNA helicase RecG
MVNQQLTNASDVVFGKGVAVRQPQTRLRAVCYRTDRADDFVDEQMLEGPALVILPRAMAFLERNVRVASEFKAGKLHRVTRPQYPFSSLREGLVNALVHRDYTSFSGSVSLSVYPGHVEIWNSGRLPEGVSIKDLARGSHRSVLVNPDISHTFYLHELMERVGRGTFNIIRECKANGMRAPRWRQDSAGVSLTFFAPTGNRQTIGRLNSRQAALLESLKVGDTITPREYETRHAGEVTDRQARRDLAALARAGFLDRTGKAAATVYHRLKTSNSSDSDTLRT